MGKVNYKIKQFKNSNSAYNNYYYPRAVVSGEVNLYEIAEKIQANCSLKKGDVLACLTELVEYVREALLDSKRVRLNGLGMFRIGIITKKMVKNKEDFTVRECIGGYRVNFLPEYNVEASGRHNSKLLSGASVTGYQEYVEGVNDREGDKVNKIGKVED